MNGPGLLAVYGSLRSGFAIPGAPDGLRAGLVARGPCVIPGLLFDLGEYPGMVEGDGRVIGELVEIVDPDVWRRLDRYEGFDPALPERSLFVRRAVRLVRPSIDAEVYFFNGDVIEHRRIDSGDWAERRQRVSGEV